MNRDDSAFDEMLSAHLDGEATAEEHAKISGDPRARRRLAELAAARDALKAEPVPAAADDPTSGDARDRLLDAVFDRLDQDCRSHAAVSSLPARRSRPATRHFAEPSRLLAAAAAVIAVALLGTTAVMLSRQNADNRGDSAASSPATDTLTSQSDQRQENPSGAPSQPSGVTDDSGSESVEHDLGSFDSQDELAHDIRTALLAPRHVADSYDTESATTKPAAGPERGFGFNTEPLQNDSCPHPVGTVGYYSATLAQRPVLVRVVDDTSELSAVVIDQHSCVEVQKVTQE